MAFEITSFLENEIEKSKAFLSLQREHYAEDSISVEKAKMRLEEQERLLRESYGF